MVERYEQITIRVLRNKSSVVGYKLIGSYEFGVPGDYSALEALFASFDPPLRAEFIGGIIKDLWLGKEEVSFSTKDANDGV
jgi:hypothetical protein